MVTCNRVLRMTFVAFFVCCLPLMASLPVDVSFLIVDLKWHETRGAQVCEIQHGVKSAFKGYRFLYGDEEQMAGKILVKLNNYFPNSWVFPKDFADPGLKEKFVEDPQWSCFSSLTDLMKDNKFLLDAIPPPDDWSSLMDYRGFVFCSPHFLLGREKFRTMYPGVVLIDSAFDGHVANKYIMTKLFMGDSYTEAHKPLWGYYTKKEKNLAEKILNDIPSDKLVIKPLNEYCGRGVIILKREELKATLKSLFKKKNKKTYTDPAYEFWRNGSASEFMVEEFIESEPVFAPHLGKTYCPTIRTVFLLFYDQGKIQIDCLGGYYNLPGVSFEEGGTLNQVCKSSSGVPYFEKVEPELLKEASEQIKEVLHIIYKKRLGL